MSEKATDTPDRSERRESSGLLLRHPDGSSFRFDPGALCLELLPTGGPGPLVYFEVLHEPADLVRWAQESRLPGGLGPGGGPGYGPGPALVVSAGEVAEARGLRDALWRLAEGHVAGAPPGPDDLATLNDAAARPPLTARLAPGGNREWAPGGTGAGLLSTVARDAVDLFTGAYAHRVRTCGAHGCRLLFVDTSRPGKRRWCSMERCGNRHKVRAHRARRTADGE
ncbi:CGNR zinc finger domain-containing protein [Streptomyces sp. VB1]|uniref:CGNR zinc finger domain-containing protein n=1 Tax=Streptomyces sp. VB1 TaxID=2986803 RepID=UPI002241B743|nr:ABATE domain-containing protein [Streptomyces sp. VB1]UZI29394.1 ABATE domain-containing protein [Streptomyces sp. VB1]